MIYALIDPRSGKVLYVGVTDNPQYRYKEHIRCPPKESLAKNNWIKELLSLGLKPTFCFLEATHKDIAQEREYFWINHFSKLCPLFNHKIRKDTRVRKKLLPEG